MQNFQKVGLLFISLFIVSGCETGTKYDSDTPTITESSQDEMVDTTSNDEDIFDLEPLQKMNASTSNIKQFEGGSSTDGLDIKSIRIGKHDNFTRLVFDVKKKNNAQESVKKVGYYTFSYVPKTNKITAVINGYDGFSAQIPTFSSTSIVEKMYFEDYPDEDAYKFHIQLREDATVKVFDMENPAKLVVDITPLY
jgi:hypothetical protein